MTNTDGNPVDGDGSFRRDGGGGSVTPAAPGAGQGRSIRLGGRQVAPRCHRRHKHRHGDRGRADSLPVAWVPTTPVSFTVKSYAALAVVQGDDQTGSILSPLPVTPPFASSTPTESRVRLFPFRSGDRKRTRCQCRWRRPRLTAVPAPGIWTLGDATGDQQWS